MNNVLPYEDTALIAKNGMSALYQWCNDIHAHDDSVLCIVNAMSKHHYYYDIVNEIMQNVHTCFINTIDSIQNVMVDPTVENIKKMAQFICLFNSTEQEFFLFLVDVISTSNPIISYFYPTTDNRRLNINKFPINHELFQETGCLWQTIGKSLGLLKEINSKLTLNDEYDNDMCAEIVILCAKTMGTINFGYYKGLKNG